MLFFGDVKKNVEIYHIWWYNSYEFNLEGGINK